MTDTLRDMMAARADAAPGPHIDIQDVVRDGRRRVWRHRAAGGTAACAVVAAAALVAPNLSSGGDNDDPSFSDGFGERQISYASGSTIHDGDRTIDVSPHQVELYVQTDDGFVYAANNEKIYFTDGEGSEKIGDNPPGGALLAADDTGSYVGWIEWLGPYTSQAVVYDTAQGREVFRSPKHQEHGPEDGCFADFSGTLFSAIDGDIAYICGPHGVSAWNLVTQTRDWTAERPRPGSVWLTDVSNGYLAWSLSEFATGPGTIVSQDPEADEPFYPQVSAYELSPDANYISGRGEIPGGGESAETLLFDRTAGEVVELDMPEYREWYVMQWIGNDLFTAMGIPEKGDPDKAPDLLTCDASSAMCKVVGQASGREIIPPTGSV